MEYLAFTTAFEKHIKTKVENIIDKLYFLGLYTTEKAKELTI